MLARDVELGFGLVGDELVDEGETDVGPVEGDATVVSVGATDVACDGFGDVLPGVTAGVGATAEARVVVASAAIADPSTTPDITAPAHSTAATRLRPNPRGSVRQTGER